VPAPWLTPRISACEQMLCTSWPGKTLAKQHRSARFHASSNRWGQELDQVAPLAPRAVCAVHQRNGWLPPVTHSLQRTAGAGRLMRRGAHSCMAGYVLLDWALERLQRARGSWACAWASWPPCRVRTARALVRATSWELGALAEAAVHARVHGLRGRDPAGGRVTTVLRAHRAHDPLRI